MKYQPCILVWCLHRTPKFFLAPCNTYWKNGRAFLFELVLAQNLRTREKLRINHSLCYKYETDNDSTGKFQSSFFFWMKNECCWVDHLYICLVSLQKSCGVTMVLARDRQGHQCCESGSILQDRRFQISGISFWRLIQLVLQIIGISSMAFKEIRLVLWHAMETKLCTSGGPCDLSGVRHLYFFFF